MSPSSPIIIIIIIGSIELFPSAGLHHHHHHREHHVIVPVLVIIHHHHDHHHVHVDWRGHWRWRIPHRGWHIRIPPRGRRWHVRIPPRGRDWGLELWLWWKDTWPLINRWRLCPC